MMNVRPIFSLFKFRISVNQLVTFLMGYILAAYAVIPILSVRLGIALLGTLLVAMGVGALNHYLERQIDAQMARTKNRPIPQGDVSPVVAQWVGVVLGASGIYILFIFVNTLTAFLAFITAFVYLMLYTPLKRVSWLNTYVGAVSGALLPMGGWAAATGQLSVEAWLCFGILFFWQMPHFFALAWMYKTDYERAGFVMLSSVDPDGRRTARHMQLNIIGLLACSVALSVVGRLQSVYLGGVLALGLFFAVSAAKFSKTKSVTDAKMVFKLSLLYLVLLLVLIVLDLWFQ